MTTPAFPPSSRYHATPVVSRTRGDGVVEVYLARRILPAPDRYVAFGHRRLDGSERPDTIAHEAYGDPALWWRIVDASGEADPANLVAEGRTVLLPLPLEVADRARA